MKKLLAALCAVAVVISMAGCQNVKISVSTSDSSSSAGESSAQNSSSEAEISSAVNIIESSEEESSQAESSTEESSETESSTEESSETESSTEESSDESSSAESKLSLYYVGDTYKINANDKWEATTTSGTDCAFKYIAKAGLEQGTIIGVQTITAGISTFTLDEFAETMATQYETMDFKVVTNEKTTFKNMDAYLLEVSSEDMDEMILRQIMIKTDKALYVFHITYVDSVYDNVKNDIDEVLNTFELIG